jgi:hypothetical protein
MHYTLAACTATSILESEALKAEQTTLIAEIIMADKLEKAAATELRGNKRKPSISDPSNSSESCGTSF